MSQQTKHTRKSRSILLACAFAVTAAVVAVTPTQTNAHEPAKSEASPMPAEQMDRSKMEGMSMTGDVDYDFAANMRMHHIKAVDMSEAELKNGKNPQMLQMAKDIIAAQKKEITVFDRWMEAHKKAMTEAMPKSK